MPLTAGLIVAGAGSLIKTGIGFFQQKSANADQAKNIRPKFTIPQEWYNNDNIEASQAQHGLTEPAMNYYNTQSQRGLSSGLGTILQGGGNVNNVADLYDSYDTGINKIAAEDAQMKNANIQNYINANSQLANEKEKQWTINEYQPYLDRSKKNSAQLAAGQANLVGGITDIGNELTAYSNSKNGISPSKSTGTRGDVLPQGRSLGVSDIPAEVFSTPGGSDVLNNLIQNNRNSPYIQQLVQQLNQPQQFN